VVCWHVHGTLTCNGAKTFYPQPFLLLQTQFVEARYGEMILLRVSPKSFLP
jgi:hypothetical protein